GRLAAAALVAWVVATLVFFALRAAGGDPSEAILGGPGSQASPEAMARVREEYLLDEPILVQYLAQLARALTFQLGDSYARRRPVSELIGDQVGCTVVVAAAGVVAGVVLALAVGNGATGGRGGGWGGGLLGGAGVVASGMPHFWLGAVLIAIFAGGLGWLPATSPTNAPAALLLPAITLAVPVAGFLGQVMRDSLDEAHRAPFATSSRTRGASEQWVLWR